jgi:tight adherence protein B
MEWIFLLLICISMMLLIMTFASIYRGYRKRFTDAAKVSLEDMFLFIDPRRLFYANVVAFFVVPLLMLLITGNIPLAVLSTVLTLFAPRLLYRWLQKRRKYKFQEQLPDTMTMVASSLRAGASLQMAFEVIVQEQPPPISQELGLVVREQKLGVALEESLNAMGKRIELEDFSLVVSAIVIAKDVGGNLSEILDRLANTLRAKAVMEGKIRALTSQGKLQGIVVGLLPIFLAGVLYEMDPDAMHPLFTTYYGWGVVAAIAILETLGAFMIKKIVTIDV